MSKVKISVIVPSYNIEKYLLQCLESLAAQTYKSFEVILIDDGSTDKSVEIIESFISKNQLENFRLIKKENSGIAPVRRMGVSLAEGEWIAFVDGDDWVEPQYLEAMLEAAEANNVDLCFAGYRAYDDEYKTYDVWSSFSDGCGKFPEDIGKLYSFSTVWAHLYKKEIIEKHSLDFDDHISCEDYAFNLDYNSHIKSFCMTGKVLYNYRINRVGQLTKKLVHPSEKKRLHDHMKYFLSSISEEDVLRGLSENERFCRVMWTDLYTFVTNCILEQKVKEARASLKTEIAKKTIKMYKPKTKKESLFRVFMKLPICCLQFIVVFYYKDYRKNRKRRFLRYLSGR